MSQRCWISDCDDAPAWAMMNPGGFRIGALCEEHKKSWYDAKGQHRSSLRRLGEEGKSDDMGKGIEDSGPQSHIDDSLPSTPPVGASAGQYTRSGMARGGGQVSRPARAVERDETALVSAAGEARQPPTPQALAERTLGASLLEVGRDTESLLREDFPDDLIQIRPDGIVFVPWVHYAARLTDAFGVGQWALVPQGKPQLIETFMCWQFDLRVRGFFVATAIGEHPDPQSQRMSYANRAEAAKSDALVKCCKALGVGKSLWDPGYLQQWKGAYAVEVWALQNEWSTKWKKLWRRRDASPFYKEGKPGRSAEEPGERRRDYADDARDHIAAIKEAR